jgi:hypothetical protein
MRPPIRRLGLWAAILGWLAIVAGGCQSRPRVDWNTRIGSYTHDDAVRELGPPDKSATLADGGVVADWIIARGYASPGVYYGGPAYWYPYGPYYAVGPWIPYSPPSPDRYLRLTFDSQGRLASWEKLFR